MYAVVMAGGSGTRLWPLSRRRTPKQLLPLTGETSLLQQTVARITPLLAPRDIYVITGAGYVRETVEQLPQLPEDNVLGEPLARSTAVAVGLATVIARRDPDEVCLALPADHFVADEDAFRREGQLDFLDNQINPATGTIRGRAIFQNRDLSLTPGSFVRLRLPGSAAYRARRRPGFSCSGRRINTSECRRRLSRVQSAELRWPSRAGLLQRQV